MKLAPSSATLNIGSRVSSNIGIAGVVREVGDQYAQRSVSHRGLVWIFQTKRYHAHDQHHAHERPSGNESKLPARLRAMRRTQRMVQSRMGAAAPFFHASNASYISRARLIAVLRLDLQTFRDDVTQILRNGRIELTNGDGALPGPLVHRGHCSLGLVGKGSR